MASIGEKGREKKEKGGGEKEEKDSIWALVLFLLAIPPISVL